MIGANVSAFSIGKAVGRGGGGGVPAGQVEYTSFGTFSFVAPEGVTEVSAVVVGAGGAGIGYFGQAGAGGGLAYKNAIAVTAGNSYTVIVGRGGLGLAYGGIGTTAPGSIPSSNGVASLFTGDSITVKATGGQHGGAISYTGGYANQTGGAPSDTYDGGGTGGICEGNYSVTAISGLYYSSGGGGAGGYSGNGGKGAGSLTNNGVIVNALAGSGGGGGGGGARLVSTDPNSLGGSGGGGVGILGEGASGSAGATDGSASITTQVPASVGGLGSGGSNGNYSTVAQGGGSGGAFGGGGGSGHGDASVSVGGAGAHGAVRIIWGVGRAYPSTNTGNV
tara:strand:- start:450 stop:1454 length:1005 start_codon:yes stop_codon:yes gene_type:complete